MKDFFEQIMTLARTSGLPTMPLHGDPGASPHDAACQEWLRLAKRGISPFSTEFATGVRAYSTESPAQVPLALPRLQVGDFDPPYLPIEALRDAPLGASLFQGSKVAKVFQSSGTTSASRSSSLFSPQGLSLYHLASLYTFRYLLRVFFGPQSSLVRGLSLIPRETEWPDSSLAQMVAWISKLETVHYVRREEWRNDHISGHDQPVWLFGTAFHLMDLIDTPGVERLPQGSLVIETGGTKGRARPLPRDEFYGLITAKLGVPPERIVSEYGMCEIASQAYDFVPPGDSRPLGARNFQFPAWVQPYVVTEARRGQRQGSGLLAIHDPLRPDYPWILRTEDLVTLSAEGFRLLGRLERAPLKGCSLRVDQDNPLPAKGPPAANDVEERQTTPVEVSSLDSGSVLMEFQSDPARMVRARAALDLLAQLEAEIPALALELGSERAARAAYLDLQRSAPDTVHDLLTAAEGAITPLTRRRWLMVLPESHSVVGIYPTLLGYLIGLRMMVRLPTRFDTEDSFISRFLCRLANLPAAQLQVVGPSLRLQEGARVPDLWDHVLVYGDDTTVTHFRRILPMPVQGFGGRIGVTIAVASDLDKSATHELVRDALSLGQQGCMATRLTFVHDPLGEVRESAWIGTVAEAMAAFWGSELPLSRRAALDGEAWRLERQNFRCWMGPTVSPKATTVSSFGLIATRVVELQDLASAVTIEDLAMAPFTLPIILVRGGTTHEYLEEAARLLSGFPPLAACSVTASVLEAAADPTPFPWTRFALRPLGHSNAPVWDGRHEGLPLFSADYDKI